MPSITSTLKIRTKLALLTVLLGLALFATYYEGRHTMVWFSLSVLAIVLAAGYLATLTVSPSIEGMDNAAIDETDADSVISKSEPAIGQITVAVKELKESVSENGALERNNANTISLNSSLSSTSKEAEYVGKKLHVHTIMEPIDAVIRVKEPTSSCAPQDVSWLKETTTSMKQVHALARESEIVKYALDALSGVEKSSKKVSDTIDIIDEIAFQTNLLALNMAVEVGRFGETEESFTAVAKEVRVLAGRLSSASKEIKQLIQEVNQHMEQNAALIGEVRGGLQETVSAQTPPIAFAPIVEKPAPDTKKEYTLIPVKEMVSVANKTGNEGWEEF